MRHFLSRADSYIMTIHPTSSFLQEIGVKPEKTQIKTKTYLLFEKIVKEWISTNEQLPIIVDIGAGKGDNVKNLELQNIPVIAVEPKYDPKTWDRKPNFLFSSEVTSNTADLVFNSYVLNVVADSTAKEIIKDIERILKPGGRALVITRTINDVENNTKPLIHPKHGELKWSVGEKVTSRYTYQRGFSFQSLTELILQVTTHIEIKNANIKKNGIYALLTKIS